MVQLEIKENFRHNNKLYEKDNKINAKEFDIETIIKINEKGYIKSLTYKELIEIENELKENKTKEHELDNKYKKNDDIL